MSNLIRSPKTIALDRVSDLADTSATVYAELSDLVVDVDVSSLLGRLGRARAENTNDLIVARQESGELPAAGDPERAALQALGMKFESLVHDTDAMYHSLIEMDLELKGAVNDALAGATHAAEVERALHVLRQTIDEAAQQLSR